EDGAETGKEVEHANMIVRVVNSDANPYGMAGTRIHDHSHPDWRQDVDILVPGAGEKLAYITLPKSTCYEDAKTQIDKALQSEKTAKKAESWMLKSTIYSNLAADSSITKEQAATFQTEAANALKKYMELAVRALHTAFGLDA
ncbi:hypothetical protein, partial [uncultured Agitococcus sp.]|uniref:hypothetical protein n=1 Tax=uncultured Agitococcus sp. TaxID=1506599 RepID=UPI002639345F